MYFFEDVGALLTGERRERERKKEKRGQGLRREKREKGEREVVGDVRTELCTAQKRNAAEKGKPEGEQQ